MALPNDALSTDPVRAPFIYPDSKPFNTREDWELGGVANGDPSQTISFQPWRVWFEEGALWIEPENKSHPPEKVVETAGAIYVSLSFDRNARAVVAWMWQGYMYLYWYDSQRGGFVTDVFPGACPRLCHDDKRVSQVSSSDVLFFYLYQGNLCVRYQRDRYGVEHVLGPVPPKVALLRVGMGTNLRVQIEAMQTVITW